MSKAQPRRVAVAIPFDRQEGSKDVYICLVSSRKHQQSYVLPKGGVEHGEHSAQAAVREMWEEAGLRPTMSGMQSVQTDNPSDSLIVIATVDDHKAHKKSAAQSSNDKDFVPRARYEAFLVPVKRGSKESELNSWPEEDERRRIWLTYEEACKAIEWRRDIHTLLLKAGEVLYA